MGRKKKTDDDGLLTPLELEVMTVLWKKGEASASDVLEALPSEKAYAYTTVSTVLRILVSKGTVNARAEGRGHLYSPALDKSEYEARTLKHVVATVFDGEPTSLLRRLIDEKAISKSELDEIKELLDKRGKR